MKNKKIIIKLHYDRKIRAYEPTIKTDVRLGAIKDAFDRLTLTDNTIDTFKVRHTNAFVVKHKIRGFFARLKYIFKAIKTACRKDFYSVYVDIRHLEGVK